MAKSYRGRPDAKLFVLAATCLACVIAVIFCLAINAIDGAGATALMISAIVLVVILIVTITPDADGIDISLSNLPGLYGLVFGLYYLMAIAFYVFRDDVAQNNVIEISLLTLGGFVGFLGGVTFSGSHRHPQQPPTFTFRQAWSFLLLSWIGFFCILIGNLYLISVGAFFTHGFTGDFSQSTVGESLIQETTLPFQSPILMMSAMLSVAGPLRSKGKFSLWVFMIVECGLNLLAGKFRDIIGLLVVVGAVFQSMGGIRISLRRVLIAGVGCFVALVVIFTSRLAYSRGGGATAGPLESIALISEGISSVAGDSQVRVIRDVERRGSETVNFLSVLIDRKGFGEDYVYGQVMLDSLSSVVPHILWKDKPPVVPPQRLIRRAFGLSDADDTVGPLIAYFAFGGPVGVVCGLFVFGALIGYLQRWASSTSKVFPLLLFFWILSTVVFVETDQLVSIIMAARHCLIAWVLFAVIHFFYRVR